MIDSDLVYMHELIVGDCWLDTVHAAGGRARENSVIVLCCSIITVRESHHARVLRGFITSVLAAEGLIGLKVNAMDLALLKTVILEDLWLAGCVELFQVRISSGLQLTHQKFFH